MTGFEKTLILMVVLIWVFGYQIIFAGNNNRTIRLVGLLWPLLIIFILLAGVGIGLRKIRNLIVRG